MNEVCRPSCSPTLRRTNMRAVSSSERPSRCAMSPATMFHTCRKLSVVFTPAKVCAMSVCSAVRAALVADPSSLVSLKSRVYRALVSVGGGSGRNCVLVSMANGTTLA